MKVKTCIRHPWQSKGQENLLVWDRASHLYNFFFQYFSPMPRQNQLTQRVSSFLWVQRTESTEAHVPTPWYGQYRMHAHNHITRAVAAMDSCFALLGAHKHGIASIVTLTITDPAFYCWGGCISTPLSASSTLNMWKLLVGNWKTFLPWHTYGDGIYEFAYIWQREWFGIIMRKFWRKQIHFFLLAPHCGIFNCEFLYYYSNSLTLSNVGDLIGTISKSRKRKKNAHLFTLYTRQ